MKNLTKNLFTASLFTIGFSASAFAAVYDEVERSFDVSSESNFAIENINGSVEINSWSQDTIKVVAKIKAKNQEHLDRINIEMNQTGNGVTVETKYKKTSWNNNSSGEVNYSVMVPENVDLKNVSLVNGSLVISDVAGDVKAELVNGSIKASGLSGDGQFSSVNGSVTVSYDELATDVSEIELETVNGSVKLSLPNDVSARIDAETMHGGLKNDFGLPVEKGMFTGKNMKGTIGSGDINISMESVNGSVRLLKR